MGGIRCLLESARQAVSVTTGRSPAGIRGPIYSVYRRRGIPGITISAVFIAIRQKAKNGTGPQAISRTATPSIKSRATRGLCRLTHQQVAPLVRGRSAKMNRGRAVLGGLLA